MRWFRRKTVAYPDWSRLLGADLPRWHETVRAAQATPPGSGPPRVLLATSLGGYWAGATLDSVLAVALSLRGARVDALLCDSVLPACQICELRHFSSAERFAERGPRSELCRGCSGTALQFFEGLRIAVHRYSAHLTDADRMECAELARTVPREQIPAFRDGEISVGEHAVAGALRFFARGDLEGEPSGEAILRRYLEAALLTARAAARLLDENDYSCVVLHHAIYVPQGVIASVARARGVRVVSWNPAYRKHAFIFSHDDSYHHTMLSEPTSSWEQMSWTPRHETELMEYLESRRQGTQDWIWFHESPREEWQHIAGTIGLRPDLPVIGLLTNVIWDAQLHYPASAFESMRDWLFTTVRAFGERPDLQLVIRVHPAEIRGTIPSRQRVVDELSREFPQLPANVFVVPPGSPISTYALLDRCNAALIYGTKTGVELVARGLPVIVAGEAWVRQKGITLDASSATEYAELLARLPLSPLSPEGRDRARRYAYHFFFRRMIPLEFFEPIQGDPPFRLRLDGLDLLQSGRSAGLDVICDGILSGRDFIYPAERTGWMPNSTLAEAR